MINLANLQLDNKKIILIIVVFCAVVYIDYSFLLKPQIAGSSSMTPKIAKLKQDLDSLSRDLARMRESKSKQAETAKKLKQIKKVISEAQISALLNDISRLANKNEVKINQIRPSKETQVQPAQPGKVTEPVKFTPFFIKLDLVADYHRLGRFIGDLENAPVFISVQDFKISSQLAQGTGQVDYGKQNVDITLVTYVK